MRKVGIYLAGTIYNEDLDRLWKPKLRNLLSDDVYEFFDPDPKEGSKLYVVARDKAEIQKCDILIAYIQYPTVGTSMEILYASMLETKAIIVINPNAKMIENLWLVAHAHLITTTIENCVDHVKSMKF